MSTPNEMYALTLNSGGYSNETTGMALPDLSPYVTGHDIAVPQPKSGQVLIRTSLASINPSDVMFIKGLYGQPRVEGHPAGFEGVGEVVASGGGFMANRLKGKRVAFVASPSGSWAEYAVAEAATCIPLRSDVRDEDGAAMIVNPLTAYAMFDIVKQYKSKAFVMSAASSQLCKLIAGLAKDEGYRAIGIVRRDEQIAHLKELGAAHVLNSVAPGFGAELRAVLKDEKPRIFLDAVTGTVAAKIFHEMGRKSRWIVYGRLDDKSDTTLAEPGQLIFMDKHIEGFWLVKWMRETSLLRKLSVIRTVQSRFASGAWQTEVAAKIPLRDAHGKLPAALEGANEGKVYLTP